MKTMEYGALSPCEKPPWNSMDFHGNFSMEFHGGLGHQLPWNSMEISPQISMENIRTPISMEISTSIFSIEDQDIFHGIPWKSSMQFHRNYSIDYSMDLQGVSWNSQVNQTVKISSESNGIHNRFWSTAIYLINIRTA